ncbi:hypothetical protein [Pseudomonas sp. RGB]|uniref:hypothetical protein n=1 Tax=Pseudomonas sp. RGB TaxID=2598474 RepID=UPI003558CC2C
MNPNNWKHCIALGLLALTFGAHADASQKPDIQRVLSTTEDARSGCGVVNARMPTWIRKAGHRCWST